MNKAIDVAFFESLLRFEQKAPRNMGQKDDKIREELELSPIRYYQLLNQAIDEPSVVAQFPVLSARLRRKRETRAVQRQSNDVD